MPEAKKPTGKQLSYLRSLARRTGTTFTYPATSKDASAEIKRLKTIATTGFSFAELQAEQAARREHGDVPLTSDYKPWETQGYGSSATWSQRS
jgi:hypothetical protein